MRIADVGMRMKPLNGSPISRIRNTAAEVDSATISAVVRRWAEDDPYRAKAIRDANAGRISNKDALALDPLLKESLTRRKAQDNAATIRDGLVLGDGFDDFLTLKAYELIT